MDRFANPEALMLFLLLPPVAWAMLRSRRQGSLVFSAAGGFERAPRGWRARLRPIVPILRLAALALLIIALARPQEDVGRARSRTDGVAIEIVLDRSMSMADPMEYEGRPLRRIDVVKRVLESFIAGDGEDLRGREGDLLGLIAFARYAETVCPLVSTHETLLELVRSASIASSRSEDGTAIGDAIALAAARLHHAERELLQRLEREVEESTADQFRIKSKAIILLTDGQNNAGERSPREAAELAANWGVKIYAIGIGDSPNRDPTLEQLAFMSRRTVDEHMLKAVSSKTGGRYWLAGDADALTDIYEEIDRLETTEVETLRYSDMRERYLPLAVGAGVLLLLEISLSSLLLRRAP
jgi:Ca-activated chloride channel family protein